MKYVYIQDKSFKLTTFIAKKKTIKYLLKIIEIYIPTVPS